MMKSKIICLAFLTSLVFSCKTKNEGDKSLSKSEKVRSEIDIIADSVQSAWTFMVNSDDQKLRDIKRLLDEVSYTNSYNTRLYDSLVIFHKQLISKRYDSISMADSQKIDAYDHATDSLLKATFKLVNTTPEIETHPIAKTLIEDIMSADNNLVLYRARYDRWAKEFNSYLDKNSKKIKKLGPPYDSYKKKPMFTVYN